MSALICWLSDVGDDQVALLGGKAANLGRLVRLGLPVPSGFVLTTEAYRQFLSANRLRSADPTTLRQSILVGTVPPEISGPLLDAYERLGGKAVAVRSSATAEDLAEASFAGQHDTVLDVVGQEALLSAVRACWASLWSDRAVEYRRQRGWDERALALGVVVQAMVPAEWSGVLFSVDPVSGRRDRLTVESVPGLGETLVSGQAGGTRSVLDRSSLRLVEGEDPLPSGMIEELARLGLRVESAFGRPQDVEWAIAAGRCYLLQARPITTLRADQPASPPAEPRRYSSVQRAMAPSALDHLPVPPYPLDLSLYFRPLFERVFGGLGALGLEVPAIDEILREVGDGIVQIEPPAVRPTLRILTLPLKLPAMMRARPEDWLARCRGELTALCEGIDAEDLSGLSESELLERIDGLGKRLVDLSLPRFAPFPRGLLASYGHHMLVSLAVGRRAQALERDLLAAVPCVTTDANRELRRLARRVQASADLRREFLDEPPERLPALLAESEEGRALVGEVDTFLCRFGGRETTMPGAAIPAWRDEPSLVYGLLKGLVAADPAAAARDDDAERVERGRRALVASLSRGPLGLGRRLLIPLSLGLLGEARAFVAFREDSHFLLFSAFPVIRRLALELGRRLVARGALGNPEDVFLLTIDELRQVDSAAGVRETVERRRRARAGRHSTVPVELLEASGAVGQVRGAPVSSGQAVGEVRVISSEREFWKLRRGEVLVAPYTNPTWTPLFALASAVVVDAGGAASHAAIVAREYGIPAVMGVGDATTRLRDGQRVFVDGTKGTVSILGDS